MADHQFFTYDAPMPDLPAMQQTYYDPSRLINMANSTGPQDYSDALPFWKRSEPMRPMYEIGEASSAPPPVVPVTEPVKHRRTRSGCLTCRARRVKCDEARPICDRCRKGSRDCVYPPENQGAGKGGSRSKNVGKQEHESSSSDEQEDDPRSLETIADEEGESHPILSKSRSSHVGKPRSASVSRKQSVQSLQRRRGYRHPSESSSTSKDKSQSPSTDASGPFSTSATPASSLRTMPKSPADHPVDHKSDSSRWTHLKPSLQRLLEFHQQEVTFYHYFLKYDLDDFIHTTFVDIAVSYEPLLYAVTGFAAYHRSLRQSDGELKDFLGHYSKSMSLLRDGLQKGQKHCEASLLTILQLATFEEYMGDWINLAGHQRAAHHMLTELYTPETILETETNRTILSWYSRFDVVVGLLAGSETILDREWYVKWKQWNAEQAERDPFDYETRYAAMVSSNRLHGMDMAVLLGKFSGKKISMDDFLAESRQLEQNIADLKSAILSLNESEHRVTSFPHAQPLGPDEIVNPYVPGGLFREPLFFLNYAWIDWYSMKLMFTYQISLILQRPLPPELETWALEQFRIFEAIDRWPESPPGAVMGTHSSVGIASVFLPKDQRHTMWSRRKLAQLEQMGYIFPPTFRTKMAELWHDPEVNRWWLPNDEGLFPLLQSIRAFAVERAKENSQPLDHKAEDLRDMKAIFSRLNIDESPRSSNSPGDGA